MTGGFKQEEVLSGQSHWSGLGLVSRCFLSFELRPAGRHSPFPSLPLPPPLHS